MFHAVAAIFLVRERNAKTIGLGKFDVGPLFVFTTSDAARGGGSRGGDYTEKKKSEERIKT